jgi:PEP-CTERM motif
VRVIRRRSTRRHRRNRLIRRSLLLVVLFALAFGSSSVVLRHLSPSLFRMSKSGMPSQKAADANRNAMLAQQAAMSQMQMEDRPVYPYSVVAGGVKSASELKWMADHDPVVRAHYAGFDYDHARVVRLVLARTAYISYRIGNKVYWTRHRVTLKKGETVLTDGKITARTRCGNRVEEMPQQATSSSEPPAAKFDEPMQPAIGTASQGPPVPFQSALLNRPGVPGLGPAPPLGVYDPFSGGTWTPIAPPPLPGVCGVGKKGKGRGGSGKKGKGEPCSPGGGGEVPEPGTWLLVSSGLIFFYWTARRRLART